MPIRNTLVPIVLAVACEVIPAAASAVCFTPVRPAPDHDASAAANLSAAWRLDPRCDYSLSADSAFSALPSSLTGSRPVDLATLLQAVTRDANTPASQVVARRGQQGALETVVRAACVDVIGTSAVPIFDVTSAEGMSTLRWRGASETTCGVQRTSFRLVRQTGPSPAFIQLRSEPTIDAAHPELQLAYGNYALYGYSVDAPAVGFYLGSFALDNGSTPLQWRLGEATPQAFLQLFVGSDGALELRAIDPSSPLGREWVVAGHAHSLAYSVIGEQPLTPSPVSVTGDGLVVPASLTAAVMRERHGSQGASLVPDLADWQAIVAHGLVCLTNTYQGPAPSMALGRHFCARLSDIVQPLTNLVPAGESLLVRHHVTEVGPGLVGSGTAATASVAPAEYSSESIPVVTAAADVGTAAPLVVSTGDTIESASPLSRVVVTVPSAGGSPVCEPMAQGTPFTFTRAGLASVVMAPGGCARLNQSSAIALQRILVVDPATDWQPVGLGHPQWADVPEDRHAARFVAGVDHTETTIRLSPLAMATEPAGQPAHRFQGDLPVNPRWDRPDAPNTSRLAVIVTRDSACPRADAATADPATLPADSMAFAHLVEQTQYGVRCLARAPLRVQERLGVNVFNSGVHVGVLGDVWVGASTDIRRGFLGIAYDLAYLRWRLPTTPMEFGIEGAIQGVINAPIDDPRDVNAGVSFALRAVIGGFGPGRILPRLLGIGVRYNTPASTLNAPGFEGFIQLSLTH